MAHQRLVFMMPASCEVVFDAFHHPMWQTDWDSLVGERHGGGDAPFPTVGMRIKQIGKGWLASVTLETEFISVERPARAAAKIIKPSFPFQTWAATLQHQVIDSTHSHLIYTYQFTCYPKLFRFAFEPLVQLLFNWQTKRRFARLAHFLENHANTIAAWQKSTGGNVL
jgi:hypothetical protein